MAKGIYLGNGTANKGKKMYIGDENGKARKVKKGYIGVNGTAKLFYRHSISKVGLSFSATSSFG